MAIEKELLDEPLAEYQKPADIIGENGLLKQLTKTQPVTTAATRATAR